MTAVVWTTSGCGTEGAMLAYEFQTHTAVTADSSVDVGGGDADHRSCLLRLQKCVGLP